jgi:hypothetical protein
MDEHHPVIPAAPDWLARLATSRQLRLVRAAWWWTVVPASAAGYVATLSAGHLWGALGGAVFLAVMVLMGVVARNASAEAADRGSVRRGSLLRGLLFALLVFGAVLSLGWTSGGALLAALAWVLLGALAVALGRPTTMVALGIRAEQAPAAAPVASPRAATAQLVAALRATTDEVRSTRDPCRMAELSVERGLLIDELQARDPALLMALVDEFVPPSRPADDDGLAAT